MADALIETTATNPYASIVSDTTNQISDVNADIQRITSAIEKLEQLSPTSPTLPKLRERLAELKEKSDSLTATNDSAKSLLNSYNESLSNANTME
jgi:cell shape-determining protein MreC